MNTTLTQFEQQVWDLSNTDGTRGAASIARLLGKDERVIQAAWNRANGKIEEQHCQIVKKLARVAYYGLYTGALRFNNVRWTQAGFSGRDAYTGIWSLLNTDQMTDSSGRSVSL